MAKTAKTRIFLDTTLPLNDSKQLSQVTDQVLETNLMCKFEENIQKPDFWAKNGQTWQKLAVFGQNLENENFFQKSAWNIFQSRQDATLGKVSEKSDARIFRYRVTHARTHEHESIGPSANAERPMT